MRPNEGTWDRVVRILIGTALLAITMVGPKTWWGLLGFYPLITGISGVCPVYRVFGIRTCEVTPLGPPTRYPR